MRQGVVLCQDDGVKQEAGPKGGRGCQDAWGRVTLHFRSALLFFSANLYPIDAPYKNTCLVSRKRKIFI